MRYLFISLCFLPGSLCLSAQQVASLPDAPSAHMFARPLGSVTTPVADALGSPIIAAPLQPCPIDSTPVEATEPSSQDAAPATPLPCAQPPKRYSRFVNGTGPTPMTAGDKGKLALLNIFRPANLATISLISAFSVGLDSHSAYGPGFRGWGRDMGYTFVQDATGEITGTFAISAITHEDPRYHRDPNAPTMKRVWHAISHTYVAQHDDGRAMPNYRVLAGYPLCAEITNLYVPGVATDSKSTMTRIGLGIAANPVDDLVTEFLPDFAARVHLHVIFVSRILNRVATGQPGAE